MRLRRHKRVNDRLHQSYEKTKSSMFACYHSLNREDFMQILAEIWEEWATTSCPNGLNVEWMDQSKFERAEAILNPPKTPERAEKSPYRYRHHIR